MSTIIQVAGLATIVTGVALLSIPAAVITAGILMVIVGVALSAWAVFFQTGYLVSKSFRVG